MTQLTADQIAHIVHDANRAPAQQIKDALFVGIVKILTA